MKLRFVPAHALPAVSGQAVSSYVINDGLAIDAGALAFGLTLDEQRALTDVCLTHSHLDHLAGLPILLDNVFAPGRPPLRVWGHPETLHVLKQDILNDRVWPDLLRISQCGPHFLDCLELEEGQPREIAGLKVTPYSVGHTVPTFAYLVDDGTHCVAVVSDTASPGHAWAEICRHPRLCGVLLECSFPDELADLARLTQHLTPATFAHWAGQLPSQIPVWAIHVKPAWATVIAEQLDRLGNPLWNVSQPGTTLSW